MKVLLFSAFFFLNGLCFSQELILNRVSADDSLNLIRSMGNLITAVETKNVQAIKSACLEVVYCNMCSGSHSDDPFVTTGSFASYLIDSLGASGGWFNITAFAPEMMSSSIKGSYHPRSVKLKPEEFFTEYELKYTIENTSGKYIFSFVKEEGKFKLWAVKVSGY